MRCTPLAVWCHKLSVAEIYQAAPYDVNFTHSNRVMEAVIASYCVAIKYLLNNPQDASRNLKAFEAAHESLATYTDEATCKTIHSWLAETKSLIASFPTQRLTLH